MVAKIFIAALVIVFAMIVGLSAVMSMKEYGGATDFIGVVVLIAAWLIAADMIIRARRRRLAESDSSDTAD